jgi:hypothetical protein
MVRRGGCQQNPGGPIACIDAMFGADAADLADGLARRLGQP